MRTRGTRLMRSVLAGGVILLVACAFALYAQDDAAKARTEETERGAEKTRPPMSPGGTVPLPRAPLLKEDTRLIDVEGLILDMKDDLKASPVHRAVFQPKDGLGYFVLLENSVLEKALVETSHGERPVRVRGTVTLCVGRNYLLLDWAAVKRD